MSTPEPERPPGGPESGTRISRRQLLVGAGAGVVAGGAIGAGVVYATRGEGGAEAAPAEVPSSWDREADIVVVGSGAAAFAAAVTAANEGSSVIMLEKASQPGGTSAKSGGVYWIPNNSLMRAKGLEDPREDAVRYMARLSFPDVYNADNPKLGLSDSQYELIGAYYDTASEAIEALADMGALKSLLAPSIAGDPRGDPDYSSDLPEDKAPYGRHLAPEGFGGVNLIKQLQTAADGKQIPLLLEHRVARVVKNAKSEVVGVQADAGGRTVSVRARKAVIFGSGGFTHNPELRRNFLRGPIFGGCAVPTNEGDFVNIGVHAGAASGNMNHAWWAQIPLEVALEFASTPNDIWLPFGDSMMIVNRWGRRVVNEKITYNERTQAHFYWDPTERAYSNLLLFMVYDDAVAQNPSEWPFRWPIPPAGTEANYVVSGATWDELGRNLSGRLDELADRTGGFGLADGFAAGTKATVDRFNGFSATGRDIDFRRGETPIQVAWHGPAREGNDKNGTMAPFRDEGPYHCIILAAGTLDTKGGPIINSKAQVLTPTESPIPGLYGAGNCVAGAAGQAYWSAGGTLGPALTFGYIAAKNAAKESLKEA